MFSANTLYLEEIYMFAHWCVPPYMLCHKTDLLSVSNRWHRGNQSSSYLLQQDRYTMLLIWEVSPLYPSC